MKCSGMIPCRMMRPWRSLSEKACTTCMCFRAVSWCPLFAAPTGRDSGDSESRIHRTCRHGAVKSSAIISLQRPVKSYGLPSIKPHRFIFWTTSSTTGTTGTSEQKCQFAHVTYPDTVKGFFCVTWRAKQEHAHIPLVQQAIVSSHYTSLSCAYWHEHLLPSRRTILCIHLQACVKCATFLQAGMLNQMTEMFEDAAECIFT